VLIAQLLAFQNDGFKIKIGGTDFGDAFYVYENITALGVFDYMRNYPASV